MRECPTMCLQALAKECGEVSAFTRFQGNGAAGPEEMPVMAGRRSGVVCAGRIMLAIQDTTGFNFPSHQASKRGFGASGSRRDLGLFPHPTLAVDAAHGGVIGLVGAQVINRTAGKVGGRKTRAAGRHPATHVQPPSPERLPRPSHPSRRPTSGKAPPSRRPT